MKVHGLCLRLFFLLLSCVAVFAQAPGAPASSVAQPMGITVVVPLRTEVSRAQFLFFRRALKEAEKIGAAAVVIDMETPGGEVQAALDQMELLGQTKLPTFTFVNNRAISAGALISLATQKIYMSPTGVIGAAAPVQSDGSNIPTTMMDKSVSMLSASARAAAQRNGHNSDIAEAFIDKAKEVKIAGEVIDTPERLLTLSSQEAARVINGRPVLAEGVAKDLPDLMAKAGLPTNVKVVKPTGLEGAAVWLTMLAPFLLTAGMILGYVEVKIPGFGIAGMGSLVCFGLFFCGHYIAGLAGWETAVAFGVGLALILVELFLFPGTMMAGILGGLLVFGSLIFTMVDYWPSRELPSGGAFTGPAMNVFGAFFGTLLLAWLLAGVLPKTPLVRFVSLTASVAGGPQIAVPASNAKLSVGELGITATPLRPSGKARLDNQEVDVVTRVGFVEKDVPIRIVSIEGAVVVVEPSRTT